MKSIQVLGSGCTKCAELARLAEAAAKEQGTAFTIEKVTEIQKIMAFGVMNTPGLVVDGKLKVSGRVPSLAELKELLSDA